MEGTWFLAATWLALALAATLLAIWLGISTALETEVDVGHPAEQLVLAAERHHADLIVMGRRGKSTFKRWMLGSISERVLRYAHCPVLVIH